MASFFSELKRRNVFKVAVAYGIVAWLVLQIASLFFPTFGAPDWAMRVFSFIIILGFPIAVILAWAFELTPEGVKPTGAVSVEKSITHLTGRRFDFTIIALLGLALVYVVVDQYFLEEDASDSLATESETQQDPVPETSTQPTSPTAPKQAERLPNSVAVLPFENLNSDSEDEWFATGVHDELLNQLAKVRDLNVIARTSVLSYANTELPIPQIAAELNVETIMEGTVRYAEDNVRITTQLIDATSGAHLWSETYTRPFENIFEIETDIATQIAAALEAEFSPEEQQRISNKTNSSSPEAFALYIRAKDLRQSSPPVAETLSRVQADLEQAIALDPNFAPPHALLATIYAEQGFADIGTPDNWRSRGDDLERLARESAGRALELDPNLGYAYSALGKMHLYRWQGQEALAAHEKAMELSPNDASVIMEAAWFNSFATRHEEAIRLGERAVELDPIHGDHVNRFGLILNMAQEHERSEKIFREIVMHQPTNPFGHIYLALTEARLGNYQQALDELRTAETLMGDTHSGFALGSFAYIYGLVKSPEDATRLLSRMETIGQDYRVGNLSMAAAYMGVGDHDRALAAMNRAAEEKIQDEGTTMFGRFVNNEWDDPVLEQPEFVEVRDRLKFPDL